MVNKTMFGYDNLEFKTINHPIQHRFVDLCPEFKLKKFHKKTDIKSSSQKLNINHLTTLRDLF